MEHWSQNYYLKKMSSFDKKTFPPVNKVKKHFNMILKKVKKANNYL